MSPLFQYVDCQILYHCVTSLEKNSFWNVVFLVKVIKFLWRGYLFSDRLRTVRKSAWQNLMQRILLEPGKVYGKNRSLNCQLISNSVIQIHSFSLVRYYFDRFGSYGRRSRWTRLLFAKNIWFQFSSAQLHAFECIIQSTNILFCSLIIKNRLVTEKSNKSHSIIFTRNTYTEEQN